MADLKALDSSLVTTGTPVDGGAAWTSFADAPTFPTAATTDMSAQTGWVSLGELSDSGFTLGRSVSTTDHKGWHGTVLLTSIDSETNTVKCEFVEVNRPSAAKLRYGSENVETGTDGSVSHLSLGAYKGAAVPLVFDELETSGYLRRTVIRKAVVTDFDDEPHARGDLLVYGMTFTINEPSDGAKAVEVYRAKPVSA